MAVWLSSSSHSICLTKGMSRILPGRFLPHRLSVDERKRSRQYAEELQQRLTEMHTAEKHYESHCELNDLDPKSIEAFATFAVAMETGAGGRDPIQHSTRHGYLKCVLNSLRSNTDPIVAMRQYVVEDAKEEAAKHGRGHAPDYCLSTLIVIYECVPSSTRAVCWLAIALGLRNIDLQWLRPVAITFGHVKNGELQDLWVDVAFGKVIRGTGDRRTLHLKRSMLPGILPPPELLQMVAEGRQDFTSWEIADVDTFNRALKKAMPRTNLLFVRGAPTTYTFRRNFVHRIINCCRNPNGSVRWDEVTEYTLHFKEENVKAHYCLTAEDRGLLGAHYDPWS